MNSTAATATDSAASAWSPLALPLFRWLWVATLASNVGTWMHEIGAGWMMTSLSPSPVMVALVQTATTLPVFLLALPAGALADIVDRRRYLIGVQIWLAGVATLLAGFAFGGQMTAWSLLALTFGMGAGAAMMMPAWASILPEIVPRAELPAAIALNSLGVNVARAVGPAVAGLIVSFAGTGAVFALNAVSYTGVIWVLTSWQRAATASELPTERFMGSMRAGIRYARHAPALHAAIIRGCGFFLFASAAWGLLPLIARRLPDGGPETFGALVAAIGVGAVCGAFLLPRLRAMLSRDVLVASATAAYAVAMLVLGNFSNLAVLCGAMALSGVAWITVLSSLQVAAQMALPNWVRSRGLAVFMAVFMGTMALGSVAWGQVAKLAGIPAALSLSAAGALLMIGVTWRWRISGIEDADLTPATYWPAPTVHAGIEQDQGPVLVTVSYSVQPARRAEFLHAMQLLGKQRKRDGAFFWSVFEDTELPNEFIETFSVESWLEHLRQHERVTGADHELQLQVREMLLAGRPPQVKHFVAPR
ncbi:MAG: MFS transporter [Gammaproteobacteria bacterium]|jgi:MFS family permease|nr:MFS transporter [Gammaproteobacteria bacterium]